MPNVYRQYDAEGTLLYIGSASSLSKRTIYHGGQSPWFPLVRRIDVEHFDEIGAAKNAERDAIIAEKPLFNVQHNPRYKGAKRVTVRGCTTGRKPSIEVTEEQAEAILRLWWQQPRIPPAQVTEAAEAMLGLAHGVLLHKAAKDPARWVKDLAIKYTGSAKRAMPAGWDGIQVDADGKNVRYWECN